MNPRSGRFDVLEYLDHAHHASYGSGGVNRILSFFGSDEAHEVDIGSLGYHLDSGGVGIGGGDSGFYFCGEPTVIRATGHVGTAGEFEAVNDLADALIGFDEINNGVDVSLIGDFTGEQCDAVVDRHADVFVLDLIVNRTGQSSFRFVVVPVDAGATAIPHHINADHRDRCYGNDGAPAHGYSHEKGDCSGSNGFQTGDVARAKSHDVRDPFENVCL
jgi:hypothetical protein